MAGMLLVVDWPPFVARPQIIGQTIMVREAVVCMRFLAAYVTSNKNCRTVFDAILEHEQSTVLAGFPPRRYRSTRRFPAEIGELFVRFLENGFLLLKTHSHWILMRVTMEPSRAMTKFQRIDLFPVHTPYISCPASLIIAHSSGKVSREWPGMKKVVLISYLAKSFRSLRTPTVPAKMPFDLALAY